MPPSRSADGAQKPASARVSQLRTSNSVSVQSFRRPVTDSSPALGGRKSPRGTQSAPVTQKKLGTRIAGLESQLEQAQEELKFLKKQLESADAVKHGSQTMPEKSSKKKPDASEAKEDCQDSEEVQTSVTKTTLIPNNVHDVSSPEMDVFEVPLEKKAPSESSEKPLDNHGEEELETKSMDILTTLLAPNLEIEKSLREELAAKDEEISSLKSKLDVADRELQAHTESNIVLQKQLSEANISVSSAKVKEEELETKVSHLSQELEISKEKATKLCKKLEVTESIKESLEAEMKKLRVQTEQWRKAADAASAVLAGENGRSMSFNGLFEAPVGLYDEFGSPGFADDMNGGAKKKGSGIKMLGDLWRKKGNK